MAVIVLGMHRSGTSLTAGMLHNMGVNMGPNCDWTGPDNPRGYYEDIAFIRTNEYILKLAGGTWYNPPTARSIAGLEDREVLNRQIKKLVDARKGNGPWGWKDPRTVLTAPLYMKYLDNPVCVCTHRNPLSIANSLRKRDDIPIEYGLKLTLSYEGRLLSFLSAYENVPRIHISYEGLMNNGQQLKMLADFIGLTITDEAGSFIDRTLQHHL